MKKSFWIWGAALCVLFGACSDDEEGGGAAVGITSATVTPANGMEYACGVDQSAMKIENTNDSVDWDVMDVALASATVKVTTTLGCVASYNGEPITSEGLVIDVTKPVMLQVSNQAGVSNTYTLNVVRAKTASGDALVRKATSFNGFPANLVDWDMTYFKDKFYAIVTSVTNETGEGDEVVKKENYQLFQSVDGLAWTEVAYQNSLSGVVLPEGQNGFVIGGEGARIVEFKDKLHIFGGGRTRGADKYGNAAEAEEQWGMIMNQLPAWRSYSSTDGVTFACDTVGMTYTVGGEVLNYNTRLANTDMQVAELNGKLYMTGGYYPSFGMWQSNGVMAYTENGKDWTGMAPVVEEDNTSINRILRGAFFSFKGKLWMVGGFTSFVSINSMTNAIYSSTDGEIWTKAGDLPESMTNMFGMKAVAGEDVVYMFGGETLISEGETATNDFAEQQIYRSIDGENWEVVETPTNFTARRNARVVLQGQTAWIFGGNTTKTSSYGYPAEGDTYAYDTWVNLMK